MQYQKCKTTNVNSITSKTRMNFELNFLKAHPVLFWELYLRGYRQRFLPLQLPVPLPTAPKTQRVNDEPGKIVSFFVYFTAWKVTIFEVILIRIFPHSDWIRRDTADWIRRDTPYLSVFSPNAGKYCQNNSKYEHFLRIISFKN